MASSTGEVSADHFHLDLSDLQNHLVAPGEGSSRLKAHMNFPDIMETVRGDAHEHLSAHLS